MIARYMLAGCCILPVLTAPIAGCNSIVGSDVPELECFVEPEIAQVVSDANTKLIKEQKGTRSIPTLTFALDTATVLRMQLWDHFAMHQILNAPGTYQLNAGDATTSCGICINIQALKSDMKDYAIKYVAGTGSLELTKADASGLVGTLSNLKFQRVNLVTSGTSSMFVPLNNGCEVSIANVTFSRAYSTL